MRVIAMFAAATALAATDMIVGGAQEAGPAATRRLPFFRHVRGEA